MPDMTVAEARTLTKSRRLTACADDDVWQDAVEVLDAEVRRLQGELKAAHFVRTKIEHAPCQQSITSRDEEITRLQGMLAACYRLTGADPDGDEDWRLAEHAVREVREMRQEQDRLQVEQGGPCTTCRYQEAHQNFGDPVQPCCGLTSHTDDYGASLMFLCSTFGGGCFAWEPKP